MLVDDAGNLADFRQMKYNEPEKFEILPLPAVPKQTFILSA
jgi:hypothetical protein